MNFLSAEWLPGGAWGTFWLFLLPIGPGTTAGILVGKNGGLGPLAIAGLYFASDVVTALYLDPLIRLIARVGSRYAWARNIGEQLKAMALRTHLGSGWLGQLSGLALLSLGGGLATGAMGLSGTSLARPLGWVGVIAGDMLYFGLLLAAALGLSSVLPDDRLVFVAILALTMLAGPTVRRLSALAAGARSS